MNLTMNQTMRHKTANTKNQQVQKRHLYTEKRIQMNKLKKYTTSIQSFQNFNTAAHKCQNLRKCMFTNLYKKCKFQLFSLSKKA